MRKTAHLSSKLGVSISSDQIMNIQTHATTQVHNLTWQCGTENQPDYQLKCNGWNQQQVMSAYKHTLSLLLLDPAVLAQKPNRSR